MTNMDANEQVRRRELIRDTRAAAAPYSRQSLARSRTKLLPDGSWLNMSGRFHNAYHYRF
jgi:hypothetical protein